MKKKQCNRYTLLFTLCLMLGIGTLPNVALSAVTVSFVYGDILHPPEGLNEGDSLAVGQVITTGPGAYVQLDYTWPSDVDGYNCLHQVWIRYGATHRVQNYQMPGHCATTKPINIVGFLSSTGPAVVDAGTTYAAGGKYEDRMPDHVARSRAWWSSVFHYVQTMVRSFTGIVSDVSVVPGRVEVTIDPPAGPGRVRHSMSFQIGANTPINWMTSRSYTALPLPTVQELTGRKVRIDYLLQGYEWPTRATAVYIFPPGTY